MVWPGWGDHGSLYEKISAYIRDAVNKGQLHPGDKLPNERDLAQMFGVSRASLREALRVLHAIGLVEIKHGQGTFVAEPNIEEHIFKLSLNLFSRDDIMEDLFEVRELLESTAAKWAAERGTDEEIKQIMDLVEDAKKKVQEDRITLEEGWEHDSQFHRAIMEISHNEVMIRIHDNLLDILSQARREAQRVPGRVEKSVWDHYIIAKAVVAREPQQARNAMIAHVRDVKNWVFGGWTFE